MPTVKTRKTKGRAPEPDLAGHRDKALILVGFVAALRRSELAAHALAEVIDAQFVDLPADEGDRGESAEEDALSTPTQY